MMSDLLVGEPDRLDEIVAALREYPGWPVDDAKDRQFARELLREFPNLDHLAEAQSWRVWMIDHDDKGKGVRVRARFNRWCRNAVQYAGSRGSNTGVRTASGRAGTRARTADEFGETSERATSW